jgi:hypothetical protein
MTTNSNRAESDPSVTGAEIDMLFAVAGKTSRIVQQAASILEEEIAAGVSAAKRVEERFVNVEKLRGGNQQEVMQRFRRDAHEVVDILIDMVALASNSISVLGERAIRVRPGAQSSEAKQASGDTMPCLTIPGAVAPGESVTVPMTLDNASDRPTEALRFHCADLVNANGARLAAEYITFGPAEVVLEPASSGTVKVTVTVPDGTPPGTYAGLLQASKMEQVRAVLSVRVKAAGE